MDWQLPGIGKTITNNILPSSLSAYAVQSFCRLAVVSYFRVFPYRVALFLWIHIGLYIHVVGKIRFNSMNHVGARFKRLLQPNQPSMEMTIQNYNYPEKHVPYQWQNKHHVFSQGNVCRNVSKGHGCPHFRFFAIESKSHNDYSG